MFRVAQSKDAVRHRRHDHRGDLTDQSDLEAFPRGRRRGRAGHRAVRSQPGAKSLQNLEQDEFGKLLSTASARCLHSRKVWRLAPLPNLVGVWKVDVDPYRPITKPQCCRGRRTFAPKTMENTLFSGHEARIHRRPSCSGVVAPPRYDDGMIIHH
jgi:hypothetical protein